MKKLKYIEINTFDGTSYYFMLKETETGLFVKDFFTRKLINMKKENVLSYTIFDEDEFPDSIKSTIEFLIKNDSFSIEDKRKILFNKNPHTHLSVVLAINEIGFKTINPIDIHSVDLKSIIKEKVIECYSITKYNIETDIDLSPEQSDELKKFLDMQYETFLTCINSSKYIYEILMNWPAFLEVGIPNKDFLIRYLIKNEAPQVDILK